MIPAALLAAVGTAPSESLVTDIVVVILFFVGAIVLLILEFFLASFGLLSIGSITLAVLAVIYAFSVNATFGFATLAAVPLTAFVTIRWGLRRLQSSGLVVQVVIGGNAGIHGAAAERGIGVGSRGVMVTPGRPSGRARFATAEMDVAPSAGLLETGDEVEVVAIEGPSITVRRIVAGSVSGPPA
jgi:membrane-bound ClpP family serine protease